MVLSHVFVYLCVLCIHLNALLGPIYICIIIIIIIIVMPGLNACGLQSKLLITTT